MQKTKTKSDKNSSVDTDNISVNKEESIPSWGEIAESLGAKNLKKSTLAYAITGSGLFTAAFFLLSFTIGFPTIIFGLGLLSGLVGKNNYLGAGIAGLFGGIVGTGVTGGMTAILTIMPVLMGGIAGFLGGMMGVLIGKYIKNKIRG